MARRVFMPIAAVALVIAVGFVGWALPVGREAESRVPEYLFILAWEVNNRAVRGIPVSVVPPRRYSIDPEAKSLRPVSGADPPDESAAILVLHRVDSLDLTLDETVFAVKRLPAFIPVQRTVILPGRVRADSGEEIMLDNVVENQTRLLWEQLELRRVTSDGMVEIAVGGRRRSLAPGEGWGIAVTSGPDGRVVEETGPDWSKNMRGHLQRGDAITVLSVFNHGWWSREGRKSH